MGTRIVVPASAGGSCGPGCPVRPWSVGEPSVSGEGYVLGSVVRPLWIRADGLCKLSGVVWALCVPVAVSVCAVRQGGVSVLRASRLCVPAAAALCGCVF